MGIITLFTVFMESAMLYYLLDAYLSRQEREIKEKLIPLGVPILISSLGNAICIRSFFLEPWQLSFLISLILDLAIISIYFSGSMIKKALYLIGFYALMLLIDPVVIYLGEILLGWSYTDQVFSLELVLANVVSRLLILIFIVVLIAKGSKYERLPGGYWKYYLPIPIISIIAVFIIYPNQNIGTIVIVASVFLLAVNMYPFIGLSHQAKNMDLMYQVSFLEQYAKMQKKYLTEQMNQASNNAQQIHDISKHIYRLKSYLITQDIEGADNYLLELEDSIKEFEVKSYFGNTDIDAIISAKQHLLKEYWINFYPVGRIPAQISAIKPIDLTRLVSNALDNAVSACWEVNGERVIELGFLYEQNGITMIMSNSTNHGSDDPNALKSKKGANHGLGLKIIQKIAEDYQGFMETDFIAGSDGKIMTCFVLTVFLKAKD